jgi:hypothetical protein
MVGAGAGFETRGSENSFNVVEIDLASGAGRVQFYKYLPKFHEWKANTDANPQHPKGIFEFEIERIAERAREVAEATRPADTSGPIVGYHMISYSLTYLLVGDLPAARAAAEAAWEYDVP